MTEYMDQYDHMKTVRAITDFVAEDLSNWYIRRARRRFYAEEMTDDKKSVYATTYEILVGVSTPHRSDCAVHRRRDLHRPYRRRYRSCSVLPEGRHEILLTKV